MYLNIQWSFWFNLPQYFAVLFRAWITNKNHLKKQHVRLALLKTLFDDQIKLSYYKVEILHLQHLPALYLLGWQT